MFIEAFMAFIQTGFPFILEFILSQTAVTSDVYNADCKMRSLQLENISY